MSIRTGKVASTLQRGISEILQKEIKDPRINMVIVKDVKVSGDLKFATVYVSFIDETQKDSAAFAALKKSLGFVKSRLSQYVKLRFIPHLELVYDDTGKKADRIERLIRQVSSSDTNNTI